MIENPGAGPPLTENGRTILVVEDDPTVRDLVRVFLARGGYDVLDFGTAEEALEATARADARIDLVLTDVMLPGLHGEDLVALLRYRHRETRAIYMSGSVELVERFRGRAGGRDGFLQKPFTLGDLVEAVRGAFGAPSPPRRMTGDTP